MCPVGKVQFFCDSAYRFISFCQVLSSFFEAEGYAVVIETHAGVFVDDTV